MNDGFAWHSFPFWCNSSHDAEDHDVEDADDDADHDPEDKCWC